MPSFIKFLHNLYFIPLYEFDSVKQKSNKSSLIIFMRISLPTIENW